MTEFTWILLISFSAIILAAYIPIIINYLQNKNVNIKHKETEIKISNEETKEN